MLRQVLYAKIHRAVVTDSNPDYMGSVTIDPVLLEATGMLVNEKILVADCETGARFETYVFRGERGSGGVVVNVFVLGTQAYIDEGALVNTRTDLVTAGSDQSISISAADTTWISGGAFGVAVSTNTEGKVAFAIGLGANVVVKDTRAWIGSGAIVNAAGDIDLNAKAHDSLLFIGGSLALNTGDAGVGASLSIYSLTANTHAYIDSLAGNVTQVTAGGDIIIDADSDDQNGLRLKDKTPVFKWVTADGSYETSGSSALSTGTWYHLVGVFDGNSTGSLYLNGEVTSSKTSCSSWRLSWMMNPMSLLGEA